MTAATKKLYTLFQLGPSLTVKNRLVVSSLTRARSGKDRIPNKSMVEYYSSRARHFGLVMTEATTISDIANGWVETAGIYTDEMVQGWKQVTEAVHQVGGKIMVQLWHMGRQSHSSFHKDNHLPVSASDIPMPGEGILTPDGKKPYEIPHPLTVDEIKETVDDYRKAAQRALDAGFDGIELHGANGYLIDQFLQSSCNKRTDQYGGSVENRTRFLVEIIEAVLTVMPPEMVGIKISPNGAFGGMGSEDFHEQFAYVAKVCDKYKLGYVEIMSGLDFGFHNLGKPFTLEDLRQEYKGVIIANCGFTKETSEEVVDSGKADMVSLGRSTLANPDLPVKWEMNLPINPLLDRQYWWAPVGDDGYITNLVSEEKTED